MSALKTKKTELGKLLADVAAGQVKLDAAAKGEGAMPQSEVTALHAKAEEAIAMQNEVDQLTRIDQIAAKGREVKESRVPPAGNDAPARVAGYSTLGRMFSHSKEYNAYKAAGQPRGWSGQFSVRGSLHESRVALTPSEMKDYGETTPLADIGSNTLILPVVESGIQRFEEMQKLSMRDVLNVSGLSSDSVRYVVQTGVTRGAAVVAATAPKPYMSVAFDTVTRSVETIAVLAKVTEQQLEDAAQLTNILDVEMRHDIKLLEEEQLLWGDGESGNLLGIIETPSVMPIAEDRVSEGDTLIDIIRKMRTDITLSRLTPSAALVHPLDWETIELAKGDDKRYVWAVITTPLGPRIWGLPVVETEAAINPANGRRITAVADWQRGATLWDRHEVRVQVGFVDDDFRRNLRTIRAEERVAFGVRRPAAFSYFETASGESA